MQSTRHTSASRISDRHIGARRISILLANNRVRRINILANHNPAITITSYE